MALLLLDEKGREKAKSLDDHYKKVKDTVAPQRREHPSRCECGMGHCDCECGCPEECEECQGDERCEPSDEE